MYRMKKLLLSISLIFAAFSTNAQVLTSNTFDDITTLAPAGWTLLNKSTTVGTTTWFQGNGATTFLSLIHI